MYSMKNSGTEWIGLIPSHWTVERTKYHFFTEKTIVGMFSDDYERLALTMKGVIKRSKEDANGLQPEKFDSYQILRENELVFKLIDLQNITTSRVGLSPYEGLVSPAYIVLKANGKITPEFAEKYFMFLWKNEIFNFLGNDGVRSSLNASDLLNIPIVVPPYDEQRRIVEYLNARCSELDSLIDELTNTVSALEKYRESVINEAVTRGLDASSPLTASGKEWCPTIPQNWIPTNPKALFSLRNQRAKEGERQLTASQKLGIVYQDEFMANEGQKVVTVEKDFSILKHVEPNDFVISMRSFQGGLEYSEISGSISSAYVMLIPNAEKVYPPFYRWFFKSSKYINALQSTTNLVRDGQAMRYANFVKVPLFIIPMDEQRQIADFLDEKIGKIDSAISTRQKQIDVLKEYRKALVYEYVTGKREVSVAETAVAIDPHVILLGAVIDKLGQAIRGKTQLQKVLYLSDYLLGANQQTQYYRYAHGPYDLRLDDYIKVLTDNQWYQHKYSGADILLKGKKHDEFTEKYGAQADSFGGKLDKLIAFVSPMKTSQVERIATLFAAWNDFLLDGVTPSDDQIVDDVLTNWTENKANTQRDTWLGTLRKMRSNGIVPSGLGLHTLPME